MRHSLTKALGAALLGLCWACAVPEQSSPGSAAVQPLEEGSLAVAPLPPPADVPALLAADEAFKGWLDSWNRGLASAAQGEALASERARLLGPALVRAPQVALALALPPFTEEGLPPGVASRVERYLDGRGDFLVLATEAEDEASPHPPAEVFVRFGGDRPLRAGVSGWREDAITTLGVRLHGVALDGLIALSPGAVRLLWPQEAERVARPQERQSCPGPGVLGHDGDGVVRYCSPAALGEEDARLTQGDQRFLAESAWTIGPKRMLFTRVDFSDRRWDAGVQSDSAATTLINNTISDFLKANSSGKTSVSVTVVPQTVTAPRTFASYGSTGDITCVFDVLGLVYRSTADGGLGYNQGDYDLDLVAFAGVWGGGFAGKAYVGGRQQWINGEYNLRVVGHETGHNLGAQHAGFYTLPSGNQTVFGPGGTSEEYGNPWDNMGSSGTSQSHHWGGKVKDDFDFLDDGGVALVADGGTFRLFALEANLDGGPGAQTLRIPRNDSQVRSFWVDFRNAFGSQPHLQHGVLLSLNRQFGITLALDTSSGDGNKNNGPLTAGQMFSDPVADLHICPGARNATTPPSIDVTVNRGPFPGNRSPTVTVSASSTSVGTGTNVTFTASASDADGDPLFYFWDTDDGLLQTNNASTLNKTFATAGLYHVRVTASDCKGRSASAGVLVQVGASSGGFTLSGRTLLDGGAALGDVQVSAGSRQTRSLTDGTWVLTRVPAGSVTPAATRTDFTFARLFSTPLTLGAGVDGGLASLDFVGTPAPGYTVAGTVRHAGTGLAGVQLSAPGATAVTSSPSGTYTLGPLPNGRYPLTASAPGWEFVTTASPVDVFGGNVTGIDFSSAGQAVQGQVTGTLTAPPRITDGVRTVTATAGSGRYSYSLTAVPPGSWNIVATADAGETLVPDGFTNPVTVTRTGSVTASFRLASQPSGTISGTVTTGSTPLPGVSLSDGTRTARTDSLGRYTLISVPLDAGTVTVTPTRAGYSFAPASRAVTVGPAVSGVDFTTSAINLPPTIATAPAASPASTTRTSTLSVLGADDTGESALTYTWILLSGPATPGFSANGTNGAKSTTVTFTRAGSYTFEVEVADPGGLTVRARTGAVVVTQALTTFTLSPLLASVPVGGSQFFTASGQDQFGGAMSPGTVSWSVSGGGTISSLGQLTAAATTGGPYTVTASSSLGGTATAQFRVVAVGTPTIIGGPQAVPSPVTGTSTALSVTASDSDGPESLLVYSWTQVSGPATVTFSVNGTNAARSTRATFLAAGTYRLEVAVRDAAANEALGLLDLEVVQTPSRVELLPDSATVIVGTTRSFTATVLDQFGAGLAVQPALEFSVSGGGAVDGTGLFTADTVGGPYQLTARAGTLSDTSVVLVTEIPDTEPPVVAITSPAEGQRLLTPTTVSATATDNVAITRVEFFLGADRLGQALTPPYEVPLDPSAFIRGPAVLTARAHDRVGNFTVSAPVSVRLGDTQAPLVRILSPGQGRTLTGFVDFAAEASDDVALTRLELLADGQPLASAATSPLSQRFDVDTLGEGTHQLSARAVDGAGNENVDTITVQVLPDREPPVVAIRTPVEGALVPLQVPVSVQASDDRGLREVLLELDGAPAGRLEGEVRSTSLAVEAGEHTLVAIAVDLKDRRTRSTPVAFVADPSKVDAALGSCGCAVDGGASPVGAVLLAAWLLARRRRP